MSDFERNGLNGGSTEMEILQGYVSYLVSTLRQQPTCLNPEISHRVLAAQENRTTLAYTAETYLNSTIPKDVPSLEGLIAACGLAFQLSDSTAEWANLYSGLSPCITNLAHLSTEAEISFFPPQTEEIPVAGVWQAA